MHEYLLVLLAGLVFSACGFYMYIYFFSLGYGFSIAAIGVMLLILFRQGRDLQGKNLNRICAVFFPQGQIPFIISKQEHQCEQCGKIS
jgi:hypothetical protein